MIQPSLGTEREIATGLPDICQETDGRLFFVETTEHTTLERILLIYSTCCDATPNFYERALRQNWIVMHGSLAIRDIDGKPMFVVINAYPRSTVDPEKIRRSVVDIATLADGVEHQLTGMDRN